AALLVHRRLQRDRRVLQRLLGQAIALDLLLRRLQALGERGVALGRLLELARQRVEQGAHLVAVVAAPGAGELVLADVERIDHAGKSTNNGAFFRRRRVTRRILRNRRRFGRVACGWRPGWPMKATLPSASHKPPATRDEESPAKDSRTDDSPAQELSSPPEEPPMWRKILGIILGLCVALTVIALLQALGHKLWPLPEGLDVRDKVALAEALRNAPVLAL